MSSHYGFYNQLQNLLMKRDLIFEKKQTSKHTFIKWDVMGTPNTKQSWLRFNRLNIRKGTWPKRKWMGFLELLQLLRYFRVWSFSLNKLWCIWVLKSNIFPVIIIWEKRSFFSPLFTFLSLPRSHEPNVLFVFAGHLKCQSVRTDKANSAFG